MKQLVCHQRATKIFIRAAWIVRSGQNDAAACVICPYHRLPFERKKSLSHRQLDRRCYGNSARSILKRTESAGVANNPLVPT